MSTYSHRSDPRPSLRVGIIGGGFMAEVHARAARLSGASVLGIASATAASAERASIRLGVPRAYRSPSDLIADPEIDIVHICTPNSTHSQFAAATLDAGKHVVCEKPLATSVGEAVHLSSRAEAAGVVATVPFVYRFHPMVREARARVASGETGRIRSLQGSYLQDWLLRETDDNWRVNLDKGGPSRAFADIGSHLCDLLEFITGDTIARLTASTRVAFESRTTTAGVETEDLVALVAEFDHGAVGTLLVSQVAAGRKNRLALEIHGTEQSIGFDQENPETLWIGRRTGSRQLLRNPEELDADAQRLSILPAGHPQGYQDAFNAFVADTYSAVHGDIRLGLPTFCDGLRAVQLTAAVLESARSGHWTPITGSATAEVGR